MYCVSTMEIFKRTRGTYSYHSNIHGQVKKWVYKSRMFVFAVQILNQLTDIN